ncbi:MAG: RnfABCDGE type electron transport complex subunit D [Treponema sp.]|nr:RnfABCDGE type electron transport complex subunit D [Treponema sp.]
MDDKSFVKKMHISSSPHFSFNMKTQYIMAAVIIALLPECICGVVVFGWKALLTILVSVASCVLFEYLFQLATKQKIVISNLSAVVTGILLALVCPPTIPWWMIVIGSACAVIIAKGLFGGIGSNVFNPALTGRAVLFMGFPAAMGARWLEPHSVDVISSATTLSGLKAGTIDSIDYLQFFFGNRAGCIGETSILLILISFVFLLVSRIIDWRAPLTMVATVCLGAFISGLAKSGSLAAAGNEVLINLLTGGLLFGATFMVTDYATAPVTKPGRLIFGCGCGLITFLIRRFGGYPEGVMFSILIMNSIAPFLNNFTLRMYGYGKKAGRR